MRLAESALLSWSQARVASAPKVTRSIMRVCARRLRALSLMLSTSLSRATKPIDFKFISVDSRTDR